ncbi:MAG: hypothetical protein IID40_03780 [Planctomycetes bacterium]|nr:hypothetical protein [Planctomycetota bacterium]
MKTIQATVNVRLLSKATRLFTGTLGGRVVEVLQNARRAGATEVAITNEDGHVTVRDNGRGIGTDPTGEDFSKPLDLGGSGWEDALESSEDPAGVGLFCLAPRKVTIRSKGKMVTIEGDGWTGLPVTILDDPEPVQGTVLRFEDEPWESSAVDLNAVFCGMQVTVDGQACPKLPFLSDRATPHPELGCRIEVREAQDLDPWHQSCERRQRYCDNVLVSFHGQVVAFDCHPVGEHALHYLIDMTDEPTGIRLMLPARTCLVENEAFEALKRALELEAFRYLQRRGHHSLPYKEYLRARELGIDLPEAKPTYTVGLLGHSDPPEPVAVVMPKDFPLSGCYRVDPNVKDGDESDEANVHLLAALGTFPDVTSGFVPVNIQQRYDGYSWAKLPTIGNVEVSVGETLYASYLWSGELTCVSSLTITAHTSDGRVFSSPVCMARTSAHEEDVLVTPEAEQRLVTSDIWYHLGGWSDEGDTYDTQKFEFEQELDRFWADVVGPDEHLRQSILSSLAGIKPEWKSVTVSSGGTVTIQHVNGSRKTIEPPSKT